jgi:hypothetical protein
VAAYYTDLGDGIHTGKSTDPRVCVIEVIPHEIRYWVATSGAVGRTAKEVYGAVTGHGSAPGEWRTLSAEEVSFVVFKLLVAFEESGLMCF